MKQCVGGEVVQTAKQYVGMNVKQQKAITLCLVTHITFSSNFFDCLNVYNDQND